ncbi:hypothetical protein DFH65_001362 [Clostridium beijerinckii]|nr:hypothetical protein [Clostridium beijerinckii]NRW26650.1 hypothetical protein [Clostridium beijerinckii]NRW68974.1 hypothetical protein [Clostridium beijerinckii]NRX02835.1 hypothetical protein [Clostridium beijerinckii]NRZ81920.1 hypothetical protein [Clostridium beijerinckii]
MKRIELINIFAWLCIIMILSQYMGNNLSFLYDVFIIISLGYLRIMKTKKYNVTIDRSKKIYLIYFL